MRNKEVQVIPWVVTDSNFVRCPSAKLDPGRTVFVGALHGMLTAEALSNIFNDLFGGVIYAGKVCSSPFIRSSIVLHPRAFRLKVWTRTSSSTPWDRGA